MSLLADLFRPRASILPPKSITTSAELALAMGRDSGDDDSDWGMSAEQALRIADVYAAVRVIAETVAQLPIITYKRSGMWPAVRNDRATDHWLYGLLHDAPNAWQTAFEWKEMSQAHLCLDGNAYSLITRSPRGEILELLPVPPNRVEVKQDPLWKIYYRVTLPDGEIRNYSAEQVFHLRGLNYNGIKGMSVVGAQRATLSHANTVMRYGTKLFANGAKVGGILQIPAALSEPARKNIEEDFKRNTEGLSNANKTIVLEDGVKYTQTGLSAKDAQFIEEQKWTKRQTATVFRIPPHMIGDLTDAHFTNIESEGLNFAIYSMGPWFERWEQRAGVSLVPAAERKTIYVEFLLQQLMRADAAARGTFYQIMVQTGIFSPNEVRALENMNPRPGGDEYVTPAFLTGKPETPPPAEPPAKPKKADPPPGEDE